MPAETAQIVLLNRTLRWSSPLCFNDPFDVPRELSFGIDPEDIVKALGRRVSYLIDHPPEDTSALQSKLKLIVDSVKAGISADIKKELLAGIAEVSASLRPTSASMDALREDWRSRLPDHRILCLTESPKHAAMWYHYADAYRGVVLEFRCVDELDSAWLFAQPVSYPLHKPLIYTADGWAELLMMPHESAIRRLLHAATHTKSPDWSYEAEWRLASFKRPTDSGLFNDYKFLAQELAAIYLGPRISLKHRDALLRVASQYSSVKIMTTCIGMSREFIFNDI